NLQTWEKCVWKGISWQLLSKNKVKTNIKQLKNNKSQTNYLVCNIEEVVKAKIGHQGSLKVWTNQTGSLDGANW
ncbi:MAG: hypothetical protein J6Z14_01810, partial [Prevotella sp.]|nr:hypothetical protein [Prevotella sp.]